MRKHPSGKDPDSTKWSSFIDKFKPCLEEGSSAVSKTDVGTDEVPAEPGIIAEADDVFEVEKIVSKRTVKGKVKYTVKWKGWPSSANTEEPLSNLSKFGAQDLVREFEAKQAPTRFSKRIAAHGHAAIRVTEPTTHEKAVAELIRKHSLQ